jgi:hypothetical protein
LHPFCVRQVVELRKRGCGFDAGVLAVKPKRGDAVLWYNLKADGHMLGKLDPTALHGACNPGPGMVKWGANYWIRNRHAQDVGEAGLL